MLTLISVRKRIFLITIQLDALRKYSCDIVFKLLYQTREIESEKFTMI